MSKRSLTPDEAASLLNNAFNFTSYEIEYQNGTTEIISISGKDEFPKIGKLMFLLGYTTRPNGSKFVVYTLLKVEKVEEYTYGLKFHAGVKTNEYKYLKLLR